jgi:hypothetical protein
MSWMIAQRNRVIVGVGDRNVERRAKTRAGFRALDLNPVIPISVHGDPLRSGRNSELSAAASGRGWWNRIAPKPHRQQAAATAGYANPPTGSSPFVSKSYAAGLKMERPGGACLKPGRCNPQLIPSSNMRAMRRHSP